MASRRLPRALLLAYLAFLIYGSFYPFHFTVDMATVRDDLDHAVLTLHDASGQRTLSIPDFASNILLGVPFGLLMVWTSLAGASLGTRSAAVALLDLVLASAIEAGQLFTPERTASVLDVAGQVLGSLAGVLIAHFGLGRWQQQLGARMSRLFGQQPALSVLAILAAALAADALYPFAVTLDVSTLWDNFKHGQWRPLGSLGQIFWPDLLVEKVLPYAALGALAQAALRRGLSSVRLSAWLGATVFAAILEGGKLLVVGRAPNVDNVLLATAGALVGVIALPALAGLAAVRANPGRALIWTAVAVLVYEELSPFDFLFSTAIVRAKAMRIEWLPFASYYRADLQSALFDVAKKLLLGAFLGGALRIGTSRLLLIRAFALAALLEAAQLLEASHTAAVTDVLTLGLGAALGAHLVKQYVPASRESDTHEKN